LTALKPSATAQHDPEIVPERPTLSYRPGLDGLRAFAVLAVMGYHADISWLAGGFLGVDIFFVLSGFLITSLLVAELDGTGRLNLVAFWGRRARRLLPALALVLIAVAIYTNWIAEALALPGIRRDAFGTLGFVNNWRYATGSGGYFENFDIFTSPLRHTWSLAIEEQFYFVWPIVLLAGWKLTARTGDPRRRMFFVAVAGALASAALMFALYLPSSDRARVYFGTDTRAQAVLIGAALALYTAWRKLPSFDTAVTRAVLAGSCLVLGGMIVGVGDASSGLYYGGFFVAAVVAMVATAAAAQPGRFSSFLCADPLVAIGRLSYGLYLWHWPVFVAMRETTLRGWRLIVVEFAITFGCALASFVLVEQPIRKRKFRGVTVARKAGFAFGALVLAIALGTALFAATTTERLVRTDEPLALAAPVSVKRPLGVAFGGDSTTFTLAFYGKWAERDVNALAWAPLGCGIMAAEKVNGIAPDAECSEWPARWSTFLDKIDPEVVVLQFGEWDVGALTIDGVTIQPGDPAYATALSRAIDKARAVATRRGARLVLLDMPCNPTFADERRVIFNRLLDDYVAAHAPEVPLIRWSEFLCPVGKQATAPDGRLLRHDGVHFDAHTAPVVVDWLLPRVKAEAEKVRTLRDSNGP
jgi:peptidoglycan/LPS O-acetylase OafA/YrhL/lysophospholipase L1-like esterase